ncbi:Neurogenic locus notch-like protein 2 [Bienertia sinuspersici]
MASNSTSIDPPSSSPSIQPPQTAVTTTTTKPSSTVPPPPPLPRPIKNPQFHHRPLSFQHPHFQSGPFQAQTQAQPHLVKTPPDPIRYPLASSGRGLLPSPRVLQHHHPQLQSPEQVQVQVPNSGAYPQISATNSQHPFLHPSSLPHYSRLSSSPTAPVRGIHPHSKVVSSPYTAPDSNIPKDPLEKGTDDTTITLRDRKVRISDGASLYALCRSWLRDGYLEENQLQYGDVLKSLAKPLPLPLPECSTSKRKERDDETEVDEVEEVESLNAEELLSRHVKRAKKVRARLREERLQRIERYKSRLALLLPPVLQE